MAESLRGHLSQPSNVIARNFIVPPPRQQTDKFLAALNAIILENKIDLLIPSGDEIFYVAQGKYQLPCAMFVEPLMKLDLLRNKWEFVLNAVDQNLPVPATMLVLTIGDMLQAYAHWKELVIKPVYSRFGARALILPTLKRALSALGDASQHRVEHALQPDESSRQDSLAMQSATQTPWIAQDYVEGTQICTYSVCYDGRITAHAAYPSAFTTGRGATIVFKSIRHPAIFEWVKTFVEQNKFTGQIGFDFIESVEGEIFALECNPRATGGAHLFAAHPQFAEAFLNPQMECIAPLDDHSYMLTNAMLVYGLPASIRKKKFRQWVKTLLASSDAVLDFKDPLPFLLQGRSIFSRLKIAREYKIGALEAATYDIEWNGEG